MVAALVAVTTMVLYGMVEADQFKIETVNIQTGKLPPGVDRFRIVAVSDTHFNHITRLHQTRKIVNTVNNLHPDVLVSLGDFMDGRIQEERELTALFGGIKPRYGKYAITGNHEFRAGIEYSIALLKKAGFEVIRDGMVSPHGAINIVGIDDPKVRPHGEAAPVSEDALLRKLPSDRFTILLKHRPKVDQKSLNLFDLQLSGHTHGAQFFPLHLIMPFFYSNIAGLSKVGNQSYLYVSRGTGTFGPHVRIFSPPEVTVINLVRQPGLDCWPPIHRFGGWNRN
jgi:uncharacterized protein